MDQAYLALLANDEGTVLRVYDDATGQLIGPGSIVRGHPTIGTGRALDTNGVSLAEAAYLFNNDVTKCEEELGQNLTFFAALAPARQYVLVNMTFQLGYAGMLSFHKMLTAIESGDYETAAKEMSNSRWYTQTTARASRLIAIMRTGS